jgi:ABC-type uncharacterized transport system permease subunit
MEGTMTEFDFVYLLNELNNTMWTHIMNFTSIIFAMLVAAYFIAPKLNKVMTWTILSLFSLGAALFSGSAITSRQDLLALTTTARNTFQQDQIQVPSFYAFDAPDTVITIVSVLLYLVLASAYIATLVFFVQARKQGPAKVSDGIG